MTLAGVSGRPSVVEWLERTTEQDERLAERDTLIAVVRVELAEPDPDDLALQRPVAQLLCFQKVRLGPRETATVQVPLDAGPTLERDPVTRRWSPRQGDWAPVAARHSPADWAGARPLRAFTY